MDWKFNVEAKLWSFKKIPSLSQNILEKVLAILYNSTTARQIETEFASNNRGKRAENTLD